MHKIPVSQPELLRLALAAHEALQECTYIDQGELFIGVREDTALSEDAYRTRQALVELAALAAQFA